MKSYKDNVEEMLRKVPNLTYDVIDCKLSKTEFNTYIMNPYYNEVYKILAHMNPRKIIDTASFNLLFESKLKEVVRILKNKGIIHIQVQSLVAELTMSLMENISEFFNLKFGYSILHISSSVEIAHSEFDEYATLSYMKINDSFNNAEPYPSYELPKYELNISI